MSVVDDAERLARARCRANGTDFDRLTEADRQLALKEALDQLASRKTDD